MKQKRVLLKNFYDKSQIEVGIDEAGRGCLFGPVFVSCVIWPHDKGHIDIQDSKKISEKKREKMAKFIMENAIEYSVEMANNIEIDQFNILQANINAMHRCLNKLKTEFNLILIDGNYFRQYENKKLQIINHKTIKNGDATYTSIAAASILAKYHRDKYIKELCENEPKLKEYGIEKHKGYGTKLHLNKLKELGISKYHRMSYGPVKKLITKLEDNEIPEPILEKNIELNNDI